MTVEFIGMIPHRHASEIHPLGAPVLDRDYIRTFARAVEAGGFDRLLVGYHSDAPDGFPAPHTPLRIPESRRRLAARISLHTNSDQPWIASLVAAPDAGGNEPDRGLKRPRLDILCPPSRPTC